MKRLIFLSIFFAIIGFCVAWSLKQPRPAQTITIHDVDTVRYSKIIHDTLIRWKERIRWKTVTSWDTVYIYGTDTIIGETVGKIPLMIWGFDYNKNKLNIHCNYGRSFVKRNVTTPIKVRMKKNEPFVKYGRRFPDIDLYLGWHYKLGFSAEAYINTNLWNTCITGKLMSREDLYYTFGITKKLF